MVSMNDGKHVRVLCTVIARIVSIKGHKLSRQRLQA
jgi:hypothetical protein